jgi:hypothetical protein
MKASVLLLKLQQAIKLQGDYEVLTNDIEHGHCEIDELNLIKAPAHQNMLDFHMDRKKIKELTSTGYYLLS